MASDRLRNLNGKEDEELKMDMSPMIDMVFLLLIFFIVVSTPLIVKGDPEVKPAVAYNAKDPGSDTDGRIVVNVRKDGSVYPLNVEDGELSSEAEITEYVSDLRELYVEKGWKPTLHLRGDKEVIFKHAREVIKAAAAGGVSKVVFAAFEFEKK